MLSRLWLSWFAALKDSGQYLCRMQLRRNSGTKKQPKEEVLSAGLSRQKLRSDAPNPGKQKTSVLTRTSRADVHEKQIRSEKLSLEIVLKSRMKNGAKNLAIPAAIYRSARRPGPESAQKSASGHLAQSAPKSALKSAFVWGGGEFWSAKHSLEHSLGHSELGAQKHFKGTLWGTFRPRPLSTPVNGGWSRKKHPQNITKSP